jgi:hypothetical protein
MRSSKSTGSKNILMFLILSLTLGLAPFFPEPHLFGKLRWVAGGAVGMQPMDWFDLVLHGTPWVLLIYTLIVEAKRKFF